MNNREISISPFYDLICTAIYPKIRKKYAFKIEGQVLWSEINSKHLRVMERELKLKNHFLSNILSEIIKKLKLSLPVALLEMENFREKTVFERLNDEIERRLKHFDSVL